MKKYFRLFLALTMMVGLFTACGRENAAKSSEDQADKLNIVTTIFPEYDWVREILGDNAENANVTMTYLKLRIAIFLYMWAANRMTGLRMR